MTEDINYDTIISGHWDFYLIERRNKDEYQKGK